MFRLKILNSIIAFSSGICLRSRNALRLTLRVILPTDCHWGRGSLAEKIEDEFKPTLRARNNSEWNDSYFNGKRVLITILTNGITLSGNSLVNRSLISALIALKLFLMSICYRDLLELQPSRLDNNNKGHV